MNFFDPLNGHVARLVEEARPAACVCQRAPGSSTRGGKRGGAVRRYHVGAKFRPVFGVAESEGNGQRNVINQTCGREMNSYLTVE